MEPRRSRASKWTPLPNDYVKQVVKALTESFADETKSGKFIFEGRIYPDELLVRMGFLEKGRLRQRNFEVSIDYQADKDNTLKLLGLVVDVAATMLEELFAATDDKDFPQIWQPFEVEGRTVYLQFSAENSELDELANRLLGTAEEKLVRNAGSAEADDPESLEGIKRRLGLNDDNDSPDDESEGDDGAEDEGPGGLKH